MKVFAKGPPLKIIDVGRPQRVLLTNAARLIQKIPTAIGQLTVPKVTDYDFRAPNVPPMISGVNDWGLRSRRVWKKACRSRRSRNVTNAKFREHRVGVRVGIVRHALGTSKCARDIVKLSPKRERNDLRREQNLLHDLVVDVVVTPPLRQV